MTPESRHERRLARLAILVSFSSFFVFPAVPLGRTGALSIPTVLAACLVVIWMPRLTTSEWQPFAWMMAPLAVSGSFVLIAGRALAPDIVPKVVVALAIAFLVVIPTRRLLRAGCGEQFILGAALAILVHAALGAYQAFAFERGEFPFADVMNTNPSMAMSAETIETYVEYIRRPFGLFAEPSAMASCVGPWLVLISMNLFTRPNYDGSRPRRAILTLALGSGLALVVASQSGMAVPIAAGTAAPAVWATFSDRRSVVTRGVAMLIGVGIVCATTVWLMNNAADRFQYSQNESWQARLASLGVAIRSLQTGNNFVVGVGPGQSLAHVQSTALRDYAGGQVTAIWSIVPNYAMETGVVGLVSMLVLGCTMAWSIWASRARVAGLACATVWLSGVVFGTSYPQQPALWTAMAVLLSWRSVAEHGYSRQDSRRCPEPGSAGLEHVSG